MRSFLTLGILAVVACTEAAPLPENAREVPSPAGERSGEPNLTTLSDGRVLLSWIEAQGDTAYAFRFAIWQDSAWSAPGTIAAGRPFFVNWADFPSVIELDDGALAAHWLERSGGERYAYGVRIVRSSDGGVTWSEPVTPHDDGTPTEHGFVSLLPMGGDAGAVWLDGREYFGAAEGAGVMTLRFARIGADGTVRDGALLDARTCDCCQTDAARTAGGHVLVFRDRTADEIRDISILRFDGERWSEPVTVHTDGWEIDACPVNGPAVAAEGDRVAVAWFSAAGDIPVVKLAFSNDGGATFGAPTRIDDGAPVGRVDLLDLDERGVLVSWLERVPGGDAAVRVRIVSADGAASNPVTVSSASAERASGFPRIARAGDAVLFAWTDATPPARVRTAVASLR